MGALPGELPLLLPRTPTARNEALGVAAWVLDEPEGFALFEWALARGWTVESARNLLLMLMVLFENVHLFNSRSETRSAFRMSPLRSPVLMVGIVTAF